MKWNEITISTTDEGADIVCASLSVIGINEVSIVQGRSEVERIMLQSEKYWDYADDAAINASPSVKAYIAELPDNEGVIDTIRDAMKALKKIQNEIGIELGTLSVTAAQVDEQDWANNWKAYFKPLKVGNKLLVCPTWENAGDDDARAILRIDPGMAFGTGAHHTTRMCLELLEGRISGGETVADIGCGSGILSIAALLLGAKNVMAVDIDPVATRIAMENAEANGVDICNYTVYTGDMLEDDAIRSIMTSQKYDVVLANIVANVIIKLAPIIPSIIHSGSTFICSGIIEDRLNEVVAALIGAGLIIGNISRAEDWCAIEAYYNSETE